MDAAYFQLGMLIQAGRLGMDRDLGRAGRLALGWGHGMLPERDA